ncbi:MAG: tetratricopeptide repeat protein [Saprospiraceae bacterium]
MAKKKTPRTRPKQTQASPKKAASSASKDFSRPGNSLKWIGWLAAAIGGLLYVNTFGHQYCLDDYSVIVDNWVVQGGLKNLGTIFSTEYRYGAWGSPGSLYRPLALTMFAIEWSLSPENPMVGHVLNVLFYAATGWLLWQTLRRMLADYSPMLPALATLLFMAHPVHTEVVSNIKSRDEIVAMFLSIAALYSIWKYFDNEKKSWLAFAVLAYTLSIFTKESVITFLAVIPLSIWFFTNKSLGENFRITGLFLIPAVIFLAIRHSVLSAQPYPESYSILDNFIIGASNSSESFASAIMMCGRYLKALLFPHPLVSDLGYPQMKPVGMDDWRALLSFAIYLAMGIWALMNLKKKHVLSFAILYFLATFSLFSNVIIEIGTSYGERLLYGPSLGFALALAWLLMKLTKTDLRNKDAEPLGNSSTVFYLGMALVALYSFKTISRNPAWYDSFSLYEADIQTAPNCAKLNYHRALEQTKKGINEDNGGTVTDKSWVEKGIKSYDKAIELFPEYHDAYGSRGLAYFRLQQYDKAFEDYQEALKYRPNDARVLSNMGYIYFMRQDLKNAEEVYKKSVKYDPRFVDARRNLGAVLAMQKRYDEAIEQWKEGLKYDSNNATLHFYIGSAYRDSGRMDEAQPWLETAYQLDPSLKK